MMRLASAIAVIVGLCALCARADDPGEFLNWFDLSDLKDRCGLDFLSLRASADVRSAYISRGKVCEARPVSSQSVTADILLEQFHMPGRVGVDFWTISSLTHKMDSAHKNMFFHERDFTLRYGYDLDLAEGWRLANDAMFTWVTLPGYWPGSDFCRHEVRFAQRLENPWVTPYYLLRRATHPDDWLYARIGVQHAFHITDTLSLTPNFYAECGNDRHFRQRYGANDPAWKSYTDGVQALNAVLTLSWKVTKWMSIFASVQQFGIVDDDARDRTKAKKTHNSRRDLTVGTIGVACRF